MAMKNFEHLPAKSLKEAAAALSGANRALAIAGGTDALGALKDKIHKDSPALVVDLKTIPGLSYISGGRSGLRIGALTPLAEIAAHKAVNVNYRLLAEAARSVASPQLRNMATIAGNLCQEPRCWYYRTPDDQFHCLRKGGTHCGALLGENRYHSVFGGVRAAAPACTAACPGNVEVADYLARVRAGDLSAAAAIILKNNPLPALTGRVCPHLCESQCNRGGFDEAVSIRALERTLGDQILAQAAEFMKPPVKRTKKKVAVVGSGPAGLAAAYYLRLAGHQVTVFERLPRAGGMLAYAIPAYRLPRHLVRAQIAALEAMGISFELNAEIGRGVSLHALRKEFDSVFLATGAWAQKNLRLEKAELLTSGMAFLTEGGPGRGPAGRDVLVIGGGNVAVDVAVSARRAGARHVTMACLEARDAMPAFPAETAEAVKAGVRILPGWGPQRILETGGKLKGMEFAGCSSVFDAQGRFAPNFDEARRQIVKADQIILAIGQTAELGYAAGVKTLRDLIIADETTQATSLPGVFAGGDAVSGPASVIHAIAAGRRAARAIDVYLGGGRPEKTARAAVSPLLALNADCGAHCARTKCSESKGFSPEALRAEAKRCIDCSCVAVNASDLAPALAALGAKIRTTKRTVAAEEFFTAGVLRSTVLDQDELVEEILVPAPRLRSAQSYHKFRIRNSIDFPIAGLACLFNSGGGKIRDARLVLSAVAPVPFRLKAVEEFLEGKRPDERTAAAAGELAVKEVRPLTRNRFKVQLIKALLQKALLSAATSASA